MTAMCNWYHLVLSLTLVMVPTHAQTVPLKIKLHLMSSVHSLKDSHQTAIKKVIIPSAVDHLERALKVVQPTPSVIRMPRKCKVGTARKHAKDRYHYCCVTACETETFCGPVQVPAEHLDTCCMGDDYTTWQTEANGMGEGISSREGNFLLYVTADNSSHCTITKAAAYARSCHRDESSDRPLIGTVNLCPDFLDQLMKQNRIYSSVIEVVKHEMTHALGFSRESLAYFRDKTGKPLTPRDSYGFPNLGKETSGVYKWSQTTVKTIERDDWLVRSGRIKKSSQMLVTPSVKQEFRRHYGCSWLEGGELEFSGGASDFSHWEMRIVGYESLTAQENVRAALSRLTLAYMEDTGWYEANMTAAAPFDFGRNAGCDFVQKSCMEWMETRTSRNQSTAPFCNQLKKRNAPTDLVCNQNYTAALACNLKRHPKPIEGEQNHHFTHIDGVDASDLLHYGGNRFADYCPQYEVIIRDMGVSTEHTTNCIDPLNDRPGTVWLNSYGPNSRCFKTGKFMRFVSHNKKYDHSYIGAGCFRFACVANRVNVYVANKTYVCYRPGQILTIRVVFKGAWHVGTIECPPCLRLCRPCMRPSDPPQSYNDPVDPIPFTTSTTPALTTTTTTTTTPTTTTTRTTTTTPTTRTTSTTTATIMSPTSTKTVTKSSARVSWRPKIILNIFIILLPAHFYFHM